MVHRTRVFAATAIVALALSGCAPEPGEQPERTSSATAAPTPQPTYTVPAVDPEAPDASQANRGACRGLPLQKPIADPKEKDQLAGFTILELRDTGPRAFAEGEATLNDDGQPASYVVAPGDTLTGISDRFCAYPQWIEILNSARRNGLFAGTERSFTLYAGDTLNLDAYTITSVGDENGEVFDNEPIVVIPPQR